jgi:predicted acylesterase/phospholipase RssA
MTALVLSAGGMFGAYQAGACEVLLPKIRPCIFAGASVGALNCWALAGGCSAPELIEVWHKAGPAIRGGFEQQIREFHARFQPRSDVGIVVTDLKRLRPMLFRKQEITWRHLAASCAVLGVFPQQRINGHILSDGGLLGALPLWAAAAMGATCIVAINSLTRMPVAIRAAVSLARTASPWRPPALPGVPAVILSPRGRLGSAFDAIRWNRANIDRWMDQGRADAEAHLPEIDALLLAK